jgi:2-polyprenyl-6-methoxyphenol hydroxylase-like FAD-dependent oxidoreductase
VRNSNRGALTGSARGDRLGLVLKVLVCGAGIAGLTLALCLERRGQHPIVVEHAPHLRDEGYMMDFFGSGYDAAERLGLLPDLAAIHYPIDRLAFVDARGRERFALRYPPLRRRLFNERHFNFLRGGLERVLYQGFEGRDAIRFGTTVGSFERQHDALNVVLSDGTRETVDLLVGADGVHSRIRQLAFGDDSQFVRPLDYEMAAFIIDEPLTAIPHDLFATLTQPHRQVTLYPIRGGYMATFFLHVPAGTVETGARVNSAYESLHRVYGDLNWVVPTLLDRCRMARSVLFDSVMQVQMPRWSEGRVALIGDACWCVSPLAGQGASMAIAGAYVLAEEPDRAASLDGAPAHYEQRLKPAIERQQRAARRIAKWFVPDNELRLMIRDLVTRVSVWPLVAPVLRRRMAAHSIFAVA